MGFFDGPDSMLGHKPATEPIVVVNSLQSTLDQEHEQEHDLVEHEASLSNASEQAKNSRPATPIGTLPNEGH